MIRHPSPSPFGTHDYWIVSDAAAKLTQYASITGSRYIGDIALRGHFQREMAYYAKRVVDAVGRGEISSEEGLLVLEGKRNSVVAIIKKTGGIAGGIAQVTTGTAFCATTVGCVIGLPLAAHGANNIYENGSNLWTGRSDAQGPVRKIYQQLALSSGQSKRAGNLAYGVADISLSGAGLFRLVRRPGSWKLFKHIRSDYVRTYQQMGLGGLGFEIFTNGLTMEQLIEELDK